jgi:hypothetical protein
VLAEHRDGTTSMDGVIRNGEGLDETGGAEFAKTVRRIHVTDESVIQLFAA